MEEKFISNNAQEHREIINHHKKWYKKWWGVLLLSIISLVFIFLVASSIFVFKQVGIYQEQGVLGENSQDIKIYSRAEIEGTNSYSFGANNPKITMVEFSDYACPNCKSFFEKTRKIRMKYYSDLKIVHRDFPVIAEYSSDLAQAARCAGEQGLFWKAHDSLYENQGVSTKPEIFSLMIDIGANSDKLSECLEANRYLGPIQNDFNDGLNLGIKGTPTWFINGYRADGDMPEDMLNDIIENILLNN
ncbi:MAG: thioredoxin domain-containing protein [Patescibacteria group bacterium]|jgi:protein-disulfide isomerase|nr:thioredoxin domain-containing protein [Patescibacteria group bacterium]